MELRLRLAEEDAGELASLYRWLRDDPEVSDETELSLGTAENQPGAMGWSIELINAVVATGIAGAGCLISGISLFQQNRSRPSTVRIESGAHVVEVSAPDPVEARRLAAELMAERERPDPSGGGTPGGGASPGVR